MEKKVTQRIVIALISLSLLALLGLNIYEYQKFRYIPPAMEIESSKNITIKNNPVPEQIQISENAAKDAQAHNNSIDDPQNKQISQKKNFR